MSAGDTPGYRLNYNGWVKEDIKGLYRLAVMVGVRAMVSSNHFNGLRPHFRLSPRRGVIQSVGFERCA